MGDSGLSFRLGSLCCLIVLTGGLTWLSASTAAPAGKRAAPSDTRIPNHYIVVLKDSVDHPKAVAQNQVRHYGGRVGFVYRHALKGYSAVLGPSAVKALRRNPRVKYVNPEGAGEADAQSTPTGVKRVFAPTNANLL